MKQPYINRLMKSLTSNGNSKLGKDTLIFNITSAKDCVSAKKGLCDIVDICYARKAEVQYPNTLQYRNEQTTFWDDVTAEQFAEGIIHVARSKNKTDIHYLRFNEAGDVRNQNDIDKIDEIAMYLSNMNDLYPELNISVYIYTKRDDLDWSNIMQNSNITINGSNKMYDNNFKAIDKITTSMIHKNKWICNGDCSICQACKIKGKRIIYVLKH